MLVKSRTAVKGMTVVLWHALFLTYLICIVSKAHGVAKSPTMHASVYPSINSLRVTVLAYLLHLLWPSLVRHRL